MLWQRLVFGPIMIAALVLAFYLDNQLDRIDLTDTWFQALFLGRTHLPRGLLVLVVFLVLIVLTSQELCDIFAAKDIAADRLMVSLAGVAGCLLMFAIPEEGLSSRQTMVIFASLPIVLFLATLLKYSWARRRTEGAVTAAAVTMFVMIYMGLLPGFLVAIRRWHSAWVVLAIVLITKMCDSGAYFTGRAIGRHKLIPWLSPGKTWEGLVGGVALAAVTALALAALSNAFEIAGIWVDDNGGQVFRPAHFHLWRTAAAGAALGLVGQFGDLVASLFKRDAGIKDSGRVVPGFGGLLDLVDSPVVVAPLAYWLLVLGTVLE